MFRVGQRVVCVNDSNFIGWRYKRELGCKFPVRGTVYTIRGFSDIGGPGLLLVEIVNKPIMTSDAGFAEIIFCASRFRPLVDISDMESIVTEVFKGKKREIKGDNPLDRTAPVVPGCGYVDHLNHSASPRADGAEAAPAASDALAGSDPSALPAPLCTAASRCAHVSGTPPCAAKLAAEALQ